MLVFRRRRVRIHQLNGAPTVEGILVSSFDDHYRLLRPEIIESESRSHEIEGELWVPRERVVFVETVR